MLRLGRIHSFILVILTYNIRTCNPLQPQKFVSTKQKKGTPNPNPNSRVRGSVTFILLVLTLDNKNADLLITLCKEKAPCHISG